MQRRYLVNQITEDLTRKMVFLGGPRQVGKTTLAKSLPDGKRGYLNWDVDSDRSRILDNKLPAAPLWIFDEIHKYRRWRNYIKGLYDSKDPSQQVLVTGSARLDMYRFGGDSLQGRYLYLRLHPLTVAELKIQKQSDFEQLLKLGGFPEPFFDGSEVYAKRWRREYTARLVRDDVASLESVQDLGTLEVLTQRLPALVGSPLSIQGLSEDLQISHKTVAKWIAILERLYHIFRLAPFGSPRIKAVKKEQKHYHYNWASVDSEGARFENLVACHLLKWVHFQQDTLGREVELRYFRDIEAREVDFVVCEKERPLYLIECKYNEREVSKTLRYLKGKFPEAVALQLSAVGKEDYLSRDGIRVCPAWGILRDFV